jgi:hypothetical protein
MSEVTNWYGVYIDLDVLLSEGNIAAARKRLHLAAQDAAVGKIRERSYREVGGDSHPCTVQHHTDEYLSDHDRLPHSGNSHHS